MSVGNTRLVDFGIREEKSDIRAHVSVEGRSVYAYPTKAAVEAIDSKAYRLAPTFTGNIKTAEGYLVPPSDIPFCRRVDVPDHIMDAAGFQPTDTTTEKGKKAVRVVQWLLRSGKFPLWTEGTLVDDIDMQVDGMDIIIRAAWRIQVKCDWRSGVGQNCTGNLYIQVRECNPLKMH